jgi:alpha-galactosidase
VLLNAEYAGKYLKSYGLEYIQIDEGYQRWHGDWEGNERFPQGMKWLADKIRSFGLRPGLWIAPFVVSETVGIFKENPDWFVKNDDGSPMRVGPWPSLETDWARNETPRRYCLDISHPGAANWFAKLFETISKHWGYDMIKIDFVAWSILSARNFYDASETPASLYRKGYELIRKSVKSDCHILECGPGNITTGLVDSMRIEYDQNYDNAENTWKQYFLHPSSSGPAMAKRYYFHKKTWLNDADHVCLKNLTIPQSEAVATLIAMSGGNMISGDSLINLDENKLEILKKIFPAYNETGKPIDLFDTNLPTAFAMQICKKFAEYSIVAFFNPDKESEKVWNYPLERLWLNKQNKYLVYDFWKNRYLGEITDEISVDVAPASVTLLAIHPKQSVPQFLSSDRHVLQGAIELKDFRWDATRQTLQGVSLAPVQSKTTLTVHIPSPILVNEFQSKEKDYGSWRAEFTSNEILKIHIDFSQADNITWEVPFSDFK